MPDYTSFQFLDDDEEFPFFPEDTGRGLRVARYGLLQAADPLKAIMHSSVPQRGERLREDLFMFVTTRRVVKTMGGRVGDGSGPVYKLEIIYETPTWSGGGLLRPARPGDTWTEWSFGTTALQVYDEVGLLRPEGIVVPPLAGGDGVSRDVGTIEATVKSWYNLEGFRAENHARMVTLSQGWVNQDPLVLPNLIGSGVNLTMGAGQVRYVSAEYIREGEFYGIAHHVKLAIDHKVRIGEKDENGLLGPLVPKQIYAPIDMSGLW